MLGAYLYDMSTLEDRLMQPQPETPAQRIARIEQLINATTSILPAGGSVPPRL